MNYFLIYFQLTFILNLIQQINANLKIQKIIAIGDIHGDFNKTIELLKLVKVINNKHHWIAKPNTLLIQLGDVTDRGPDTKKLYEFFIKLRKEAKEKYSQFIPLLGNHEIMNLAGNYKYVSSKDIAEFGGIKARHYAFSQNGQIGQYLRKLDIITKQKRMVFCHGGISPLWSQFSIKQLNLKAKYYLNNNDNKKLLEYPLFSSKGQGPLWYRGFTNTSDPKLCNKANYVLSNLKAQRLIMAHTPRLDHHIMSLCEHKIILIDVGISRYHGGGHLAALEWTENYLRATYPWGKEYFYKSKKVIDFVKVDRQYNLKYP